MKASIFTFLVIALFSCTANVNCVNTHSNLEIYSYRQTNPQNHNTVQEKISIRKCPDKIVFSYLNGNKKDSLVIFKDSIKYDNKLLKLVANKAFEGMYIKKYVYNFEDRYTMSNLFVNDSLGIVMIMVDTDNSPLESEYYHGKIDDLHKAILQDYDFSRIVYDNTLAN